MRFVISCFVLLLVFVACYATSAEQPAAEGVQIDADFPGGNILVKKIEGDDVYVQQDPRDTARWWFYYNFRVRGAAGRKLTFHWTNKSPMAEYGPAVSTNRGKSWRWLGKQHLDGPTFTYAFAEGADEVRFCLAMPYQLADLEKFIARHRDNPAFETAIHARSAKDRPVHRLRVGRLTGEPKHRVVLTARHHSCEMMASHELEGVIEAILADDAPGRWLRENVEFLIVPMMDVDGVEDGDQGKSRAPHDHNRDYEGDPIYASVAANKKFIPEWSQGKLRVVLDLHCPSLRYGGNNPGSNVQIFLVGNPFETIWKNVQRFSIFLEAVQRGPLKYSTKHNLPWGVGWNTSAVGLNRSFTRWASTLPGIEVSAGLELPYAIAGGKPVTRDSARRFGHDLAHAIARYLQDRD